MQSPSAASLYGSIRKGQRQLTISSISRPPPRYCTTLIIYGCVGRSPGARDRFPRVLFLAGSFLEARKAFASGASAVPEWAFLRWVDQMLGVVGREEGPVVIQVWVRWLLAVEMLLKGLPCLRCSVPYGFCASWQRTHSIIAYSTVAFIVFPWRAETARLEVYLVLRWPDWRGLFVCFFAWDAREKR